jgi:hypothetical protein
MLFESQLPPNSMRLHNALHTLHLSFSEGALTMPIKKSGSLGDTELERHQTQTMVVLIRGLREMEQFTPASGLLFPKTPIYYEVKHFN